MEDIVIPPLPTVVAEVIKFDANNPKNGAADLEKLVIPDKAISADLLRVSNSAFYGRSGKVKALKDALAVLGIKATKNLVIYLSTKTMSVNIKSEPFKQYLTRYPIFAALIAQAVALESRQRDIADECFLSALLHNIGMNIMALQKLGHYSDMIEACEKNKWDLQQLEKRSYGVTHTELGKKAAVHWKLPDNFQNLMGISPATDPSALTDPREKCTYIASVSASVLLNIPVPENAKALAQKCFEGMGGAANLQIKFMSPDALTKFRAHPFAQIAGA
jgi:HD-like signal output (HDOD) protein